MRVCLAVVFSLCLGRCSASSSSSSGCSRKIDSWCNSTVAGQSTEVYNVTTQRRLLNRGQLSFFFESSPPKNSPPLSVVVIVESRMDVSTVVPYNITVGGSISFTSLRINKTLCPLDVERSYEPSSKSRKVHITVVVSSPPRPQPQSFSFSVRRTKQFYVLPGAAERSFEASPSGPKLLRLEAPPSAGGGSGLFYRVALRSPDGGACASVSFQTSLCPSFVYDPADAKSRESGEHEAVRSFVDLFSRQRRSFPVGGEFKHHQNADSRAGIVLRGDELDNANGGINVVVVVKPNDRSCRIGAEVSPEQRSRTKTMTIVLERLDVDSSMLVGRAVGSVAIMLVLGAAFVLSYRVHLAQMGRNDGGSDAVSPLIGSDELVDGDDDDARSQDSRSTYETARKYPALDDEQEEVETLPDYAPPHDATLPEVEEIDIQPGRAKTDCRPEKLMFLLAFVLSLTSARNVLLYREIFSAQGSCYFNEQCTFRTETGVSLSLSNVAYVIMGLTFLAVVGLRKTHDKRHAVGGGGGGEQLALDVMLGASLSLQGVTSFVYHICPSALHLPVDTNFMLVMATLFICKLFRRLRSHPVAGVEVQLDNLPAWLCVATSCDMIVTAAELPAQLPYAKSCYAVIRTAVASLLILAMYETGQQQPPVPEKVGFGGLIRMAAAKARNVARNVARNPWSGGEGAAAALFAKSVSVFFALAWGLIGGVNWNPEDVDRVAALPFFLISSTALMAVPFVVHIFVKLGDALEGPRRWGLVAALVSATAAFGTSCVALYFYNAKQSDFSLTGAESLGLNRPCGGPLSIYGNHDVWHFVSAVGCFFAFTTVLLIEDAVVVAAGNDGLGETPSTLYAA